LHPSLGEPFSKGGDHSLSLYLSVLPSALVPPPSATLELLAGNQVLGLVPLPLTSPNAGGLMDATAQIPLADLPPGEFTLRATVSQAGKAQIREATFTLWP
jgi:hypothetical protein